VESGQVNRLRALLLRHRWFYTAGVIAGLVGIAVDRFAPTLALASAGDTFFAVYLLLAVVFELGRPRAQFEQRAAADDESIAVIVFLTLVVVGFSLFSVFALLQRHHEVGGLELVLAVAAAPLAWLMLHTVGAFHYAHVYYAHGGDAAPALRFPQTKTPGPVEFLYFSFVVGMTAQTSDVQVVSTEMRLLTLLHSIVSFFFTTVLIALAVNVAVILLQRGP
jgi:uncharacterized membrane protein